MKLAINIIVFGVALGLVACQTPPQVAKQEMSPSASSKPLQDIAKNEAAKPADVTKPSMLIAPTADEIKVFTRNYDQEAWNLVVQQGAGWDIGSLEPDLQVMFGIADAKTAPVDDQEELLIDLQKQYPDSLAAQYALSRVLRAKGYGFANGILRLVAYGSPAKTRLDKQVRAYALITMLDTDKRAFKEGMLKILDIYNSGDRSPWTLYFYGAGLAQLEQYELALPILKLAVAIKPDHMDSLIALTSVLNDLKQYQESMRVNKAALKLNSKDSDRMQLLNNLGATYMDLKQWSDAYKALSEAAPLGNSCMFVLPNLAETQMQLGKRDVALQNAHKAVLNSPNFAYGWAVLAWSYQKMGDNKLRDIAMTKLRELEPNDATKLVKVKFNMHRYRHDK